MKFLSRPWFSIVLISIPLGLFLPRMINAQEAKRSEGPIVVDAKGLEFLPPIAEVAEKLTPAVVSIQTTSFMPSRGSESFSGDLFEYFMGPFNNRGQQPGRESGREERAVAGGSGIIISSDGEVLTNNHVIEGYQGASGKSEVEVILTNGKKYKGKVLGRDKELDIALIKIEATNLPYAKLGDSDALRIGQWVVAIGNPLGLDHTVTQGIISAKGRKLDGGIGSFLQTDAAINRGNSGGPLLNLKGEVIGINTAIINQAQNIGFAVPIASVTQILNTLRKGQPVSRGYLGIGPLALDATYQQALGVQSGVVVGTVEEGKPAAQAGVQRLDVITEIDGRAVTSPDNLIAVIASKRAGESIELTIRRDGKTTKIKVILGDRSEANTPRPPSAATPKDAPKGEEGSALDIEKLYGFKAEPLTPANRSSFRIPPQIEGVVVTAVVARSDAGAMLEPGMIITEVGTRKINSMNELYAQIRKTGERPLILFVTLPSNGQRLTVALSRR